MELSSLVTGVLSYILLEFTGFCNKNLSRDHPVNADLYGNVLRDQCRTFSTELQKRWCVPALSAFKMHVFLTTSTQYLPDLQIYLQICLLDLLHPDYVKENQSEMLRYLSGSSEQ